MFVVRIPIHFTIKLFYYWPKRESFVIFFSTDVRGKPRKKISRNRVDKNRAVINHETFMSQPEFAISARIFIIYTYCSSVSANMHFGVVDRCITSGPRIKH